MFFCETHSRKEDSIFWSNQWGDTILLSQGTNRSAGVAVYMNNCPGKVIEFSGDADGHWIAAVLNVKGTPWILLNVYGFNGESKNKILLDQISGTIR